MIDKTDVSIRLETKEKYMLSENNKNKIYPIRYCGIEGFYNTLSGIFIWTKLLLYERLLYFTLYRCSDIIRIRRSIWKK